MEEEEEEEEILDNAATEHKGTDQLTTSGGRRSPSHVKELELKSTDMCPSHGGREPSSRAEGCVLQPQDHIPPSHTPSLPIEGCAPQPFAIPPPDSAQAISSNAPPANLPIGHSATAMARGSTNGSRSLVQHSSKPPTKPITMTGMECMLQQRLMCMCVCVCVCVPGMEARARELAHRREEREHARKVKEMERLLQLQREQQERERADREAKEVMAAQKREEKRLAKQVILCMTPPMLSWDTKTTPTLHVARVGTPEETGDAGYYEQQGTMSLQAGSPQTMGGVPLEEACAGGEGGAANGRQPLPPAHTEGGVADVGPCNGKENPREG